MARTKAKAKSMQTKERASHQQLKDDEEPWVEDTGQEWEQQQKEQKAEEETTAEVKEDEESPSESRKSKDKQKERGEGNFFANGLFAGLGIGCIVTFVIMWLAVFFSPQLPSGTTYQTMLSIFIYPMVYLLAVGLIALTAGIVKEYYAPKVDR
jgi:cation transport ATPase